MSDMVKDSTLGEKTYFKFNQKEIVIGVNSKLTLFHAKLLTHGQVIVLLSEESETPMHSSYKFLQSYVDQRMPIYGVNTHFGDQVTYLDPYLKNAHTDSTLYYDSIIERQENLIKSHSCGLGEAVCSDITKVAIMLRAHCLAQGYSGITPAVIQTQLDFLNKGITPVVRKYGSIGASGDLIPLAMIAAAFIGENVPVLYQGKIIPAPKALELAGLKKFKPQLRDGLAMINGTSFMTAIASLALYDLKRLYRQMLCAIAMSLEAMQVIKSAYHPRVHQLKNQNGEESVNNFLLGFWEKSQLISNLDELRVIHRNPNDDTSSIKAVQDYYSLRSVAQGFGPFHENIERAITWVENEMNSINDNPIIDVSENKIHHSANFMGYYICSACDILKTDIAQASSWIHALLANMVHPRKNHNLPTNLIENPGKNNGFRPVQLLAAALTVQNRKLAQSHQAFMVPTEGDNQDVNSLGTHAAFDLKESVANLERLTAILFLASTQALELRGIEKAGTRAQEIHNIVRQYCTKLTNCRPLSEELETVIKLLSEEKI